MKKGIALLCAAVIFLLCACSEKKQDATFPGGIVPTDVSAVADFKCVCATDHEFVIEEDKAKELYAYMNEQWKQAEIIEWELLELDDIYLAFQDGDPLLFDTGEDSTDEVVDDMEIVEMADFCFYGVFWIYANDYVYFTQSPVTSNQTCYQFPEGTFQKVLEMVTE